MHVGGLTLDLNWLLQFIFTSFVIALGFLRLVKNTAVKYFEVESSFDGDRSPSIQGGAVMDRVEFTCANCGDRATKRCSRCKSVRYCSSECQLAHWKSEHKSKCRDSANLNTAQNSKLNGNVSVTALIPSRGISKLPIKKPREVLFPYDEFIELYNWDKQVFPPCGLLNCGNSCFANVVLQCLTYTRPLIAYLLEKGHRKECRREDWCFLCEFEMHVERASRSSQLFSPISILSHLPSIGGNLGHGRQEDAHEFMRFAIDRMQSVCLDEFGGERAVSPTSQETTLIQHIFGGHLQSQVICTKCNNISKQLENIMDLTVEIHGDVESLGECLDQFTVKEWLHGDNMYKCDGCNDYVNASKQLTIRRAPNILTIALKRFQSGRFGKLNKRVAFPETLDLSPYMSDGGDGTDVYKLYGVIVHVDMLNASFFGHYICYTKDFSGNWYRVDDCKVSRVELDDVLCQSAYMLLYSRASVRPSCLRTAEAVVEKGSSKKVDEELSTNQAIECSSPIESQCDASTSEPQAAGSDAKPIPIHPEAGVFEENPLSEAAGDLKCHEDIDSALHSNSDEDDTSVTVDGITIDENLETMDTIDSDPSLPFPMEISDSEYDPMKGQTYHDQRSRVDRYTLYDDNKSNKYMKMNGNAHGFSTDTTPAIRQRS